jgi:hypothetical protein
MPFKEDFLILFGGKGSFSPNLEGGLKSEGKEEWSKESVFGFSPETSFNVTFFVEFKKTKAKNTPIPIYTACF